MSAIEQVEGTALLPEPLIAEHNGFLVVRDDLLYGGTKRRALERCLQPSHEYVFASPAEGNAQLALALAARSIGARATLFVARRQHLAPRTLLAAEQGAAIHQVPHGRLSNVQAKARAYAEAQGASLFELGLRSTASEEALTAVCRELAELVPVPRRVFHAIGSGTLARCLGRAFPNSEIHGVIVGHEPQGSALPPGCHVHRAAEAWEDAAEHPPPFPSSPNYDAKVWRWALLEGEPGDLLWNVA